jgi:3-isopropylmalate dehydratase small subunit
MGKTIIEKILGHHAGRTVCAGDMVDVTIDARVARDFGGANVVKNLKDNGLGIADPRRTFFTFDCNPGGSDQKYAANQQQCRQFARQWGIRVFDVDAGIGTHLAIDAGLVGPGETFVSTDSHANILGAIGAFGQGMGDQDIAHAFAYGHVWFVVPPTIRIELNGMPSPTATPKDVTLAIIKHFGASGLLDHAAEIYGPYVDQLDLAGRVTIASMCTEAGGIILLFPPNQAVIEYCRAARERVAGQIDVPDATTDVAAGAARNVAAGAARNVAAGAARNVAAGAPAGRGSAETSDSRRPTRGSAATAPQSPAATAPVYADVDATYARTVTIDITGLTPLLARPGQPEDVVPVGELRGKKVDSVFIGSCTNGRYEDIVAAAKVLRGRKVAPGVVLKVVPATDAVWRKLMDDGVFTIYKDAGALISNAGCGGCAAGQIGQNGPGEVTVSTGNRNFPGKQGKGEVYLASPETAAATAIAGIITTVDAIPAEPVAFAGGARASQGSAGVSPAVSDGSPAGSRCHTAPADSRRPTGKPTRVKGRVWVIRQDNIDTDMIFHNRYLTITDLKEMGKYAFDNLKGWEDFAKKAQPGDIVVTGKNFGCGSSRQQAVDCFLSLGVAAIVAESFGAIYERNAINAGLAIMRAPLVGLAGASPARAAGASPSPELMDGETVEVDFATGIVRRSDGTEVRGTPFSPTQLAIYRRGGLLVRA